MNSTLEGRIVDVLYSPAVRTINFTFDFLTYDAGAFERVARAIRKGAVTVSPRPAPNELGTYYPDRNVLTVDTTRPLREIECMIVHEAAHAIQDARGLPMRTDRMEAAAFVAQAVYLLSTPTAGDDAALPATFEEARALVDAHELDLAYAMSQLVRRYPTLLRREHTDVEPDAIAPLERAIAAHPHYAPSAYEYVFFNGLG